MYQSSVPFHTQQTTTYTFQSSVFKSSLFYYININNILFKSGLCIFYHQLKLSKSKFWLFIGQCLMQSSSEYTILITLIILIMWKYFSHCKIIIINIFCSYFSNSALLILNFKWEDLPLKIKEELIGVAKQIKCIMKVLNCHFEAVKMCEYFQLILQSPWNHKYISNIFETRELILRRSNVFIYVKEKLYI